jgi:hypothetical protein
VLAFGTHVRGVQTRPKPSDFSGRKNPQHAFLKGVIKAVLSHVADLRHVKEPLKLSLIRSFQAKITGHFSPSISTFHCYDRWRHCIVQDTWWCKF